MTQPSDNWFWGVVLSFFGLIFIGGVYDFVISENKNYKDLAVYSDVPLPDEIGFPSEKSFEPQVSSSDLYVKDGPEKEETSLITGALSKTLLDKTQETFVSTQLSYMNDKDRQHRMVDRAQQTTLELAPGMVVSNKIQYMSYLERNAWLKRIESGSEQDPEYTHSIVNNPAILVSTRLPILSASEGDIRVKPFSKNRNKVLGTKQCGQIIQSI